MLVLSRRRGERIMIGGGIIVEVVAIAGLKVRLGIIAPRATPVFREEVLALLADAPEDATPPPES